VFLSGASVVGLSSQRVNNCIHKSIINVHTLFSITSKVSDGANGITYYLLYTSILFHYKFSTSYAQVCLEHKEIQPIIKVALM
jgi:hypothetical protein